ncbi:MAG: acyl-CoA dehydratase activase-related protein [Butyricicoccus sp.]
MDFGLSRRSRTPRGAPFRPDVDFIIDIGGQDIKCLKSAKGIDNISLNEACSSGCGSFIETFARSMGYSIEEFCKLGLFAKHPIDLGSRCTVFMNSSVKQAQKDGAGIDAISAGLSVSVVKNALYKVIRAHSPDDLGQHIVVQGGTFLNDAILRSFEQEIGRDVTRPAISGLMGAYGAALHAKDNRRDTTTLIGTDILAGFEHNVRSTRCGLCENHCNLTINDFGGGRRFISGNRCERPLGGTKKADLPNLYKWKLEKLKSYGEPSGIANPIAKIGLPFGLNYFELLPFWTAFLRKLGFETVLSDVSTRDMYMQGQHSIPSDTVCYPAKLMHGHIENLLEKGVDAIFYPCMTYNLDEERATNHYNCPVVAYYPELLKANVSALADFDFMMPYFELADKKRFTKHAVKYFCGKYPQIKKKQVIAAVEDAYMAQDEYYIDVRIEGQRAIRYADEHDLDVAVIAGRPYHVDPEINHGIDQLIASFGLVIVSEDAVWQLTDAPEVHVLNRDLYHCACTARRSTSPRRRTPSLSSWCPSAAALTPSRSTMRAICENGGKFIQLKIDEKATSVRRNPYPQHAGCRRGGTQVCRMQMPEAMPVSLPAVYGGNAKTYKILY